MIIIDYIQHILFIKWWLTSETKNELFTPSSTFYCHKSLIKSFVSVYRHFTCSRSHSPVNNNRSRIDFLYVFYIHIDFLYGKNRRPTTTRTTTTHYNTFKLLNMLEIHHFFPFSEYLLGQNVWPRRRLRRNQQGTLQRRQESMEMQRLPVVGVRLRAHTRCNSIILGCKSWQTWTEPGST